MAAAVLYVKNLAAMKRFYERCCGMSAQPSDTDGVCVLTSPDWELSLVRVSADLAAEIVISDPPQRRADNPIKLAFDVSGIEAITPTITEMIAETGGQADSGDPGWDFQGRRHLDCLDPEGNVVQLRQRLPAA